MNIVRAKFAARITCRVMLNGIHAGGLAAIEVTVVDGLEG
jgi:hypothetical protein